MSEEQKADWKLALTVRVGVVALRLLALTWRMTIVNGDVLTKLRADRPSKRPHG